MTVSHSIVIGTLSVSCNGVYLRMMVYGQMNRHSIFEVWSTSPLSTLKYERRCSFKVQEMHKHPQMQRANKAGRVNQSFVNKYDEFRPYKCRAISPTIVPNEPLISIS